MAREYWPQRGQCGRQSKASDAIVLHEPEALRRDRRIWQPVATDGAGHLMVNIAGAAASKHADEAGQVVMIGTIPCKIDDEAARAQHKGKTPPEENEHAAATPRKGQAGSETNATVTDGTHRLEMIRRQRVVGPGIKLQITDSGGLVQRLASKQSEPHTPSQHNHETSDPGHSVRWCPAGLSRTQRRRLQRLRSEEAKAARAKAMRDEHFNSYKPMQPPKRTWREKRLAREDCTDSEGSSSEVSSDGMKEKPADIARLHDTMV